MWRSGSSLLYALLNKHPQVGLMYEADLILLRSVFWKPAALCDWTRRWQFWNQAFERHGLSPAFFDTSKGFRSAFEAVHQEFALRKGAAIWGDKSPNYYDRLQELADTFPNARFIIVWRDPLGTINSIVRAAQSGNSYFRRRGVKLRGLLGYEAFKKQCDWLHAHDKPVLEISYEDLVSDPATTVRRVCLFLEIPYDETLASLAGADRTAIYDGQHHELVKSDEIVAQRRPNAANQEWRFKVDRYVNFWRRRYAGSWPPHHEFESLEPSFPTLLERVSDWFCYRILRAFDSFTGFCFATAPIWMLQRYRTWKLELGRASPHARPADHPIHTTPSSAREP
jgi:sulfotransferase family protein